MIIDELCVPASGLTKKLFLFLSLTLILYCYSSAQSPYLSVRLGYNETSLDSDDKSQPAISERKTLSVGLNYTWISRSSKWGFSVESGYLKKGAKIDNDTLDYKLHYLSFPLLLDYYPVEKVRLSAGPEVSFLMSSQNHVNDSTTFSIMDTYNNRWEFSGTVSASYEVAFFMELGLRYNRAFTEVASFDAILNRRKLKNSYLQAFILLRVLN